MFTIKLYRGGREIIKSATGFTILHDQIGGSSEITMHQAVSFQDARHDIGGPNEGSFNRAEILNAAGAVVETVEVKGPQTAKLQELVRSIPRMQNAQDQVKSVAFPY